MTEKMRVCVLWNRLSGYLSAALHALVDEGVELLVVHQAAVPEAPFDDDLLTKGFRSVAWTVAPDEAELAALLDEFTPHALVVNGWKVGAYRRAARRLRGRTLRIMTVHNQWRATPKQRAGCLISPWVLRPSFDATWVSDERQAIFAERLGFAADRMLWGINTCDQPRFAQVATERGDVPAPEAFLFVGRLVDHKAVDVLAEAYRTYREATVDPWPLLVAGVGPQSDLLRPLAGVEMLGFVQPDDLPGVFARAGCLVLPSRHEPWAVAIHEAASAALPIVCTRACGASTRLVLDGYNGAVVPPDDSAGLSAALARISGATESDRREMGTASQSLSLQYTPQRWARLLVARIPELRSTVGLPSPDDRVADASTRRD